MKRSKTVDIYSNSITFENVYSVWNIFRRTCKNKNAIFRFQINKNSNIFNIYSYLINKTYRPLKFRLFMIFEPKPRLVMSQTVWDKIVNHFIAKYYLISTLEKTFIKLLKKMRLYYGIYLIINGIIIQLGLV